MSVRRSTPDPHESPGLGGNFMWHWALLHAYVNDRVSHRLYSKP
jgi:hypothetical protein